MTAAAVNGAAFSGTRGGETCQKRGKRPSGVAAAPESIKDPCEAVLAVDLIRFPLHFGQGGGHLADRQQSQSLCAMQADARGVQFGRLVMDRDSNGGAPGCQVNIAAPRSTAQPMLRLPRGACSRPLPPASPSQ
jgi:hypothetical protein